MNWQPIETAPKDGQPILLGWTGGSSDLGFWVADPSRNYWELTGWFLWDSNVLCDRPSKPTHWMPLPEGPKP